MHELSIATAIVSEVSKAAEQRGIQEVESVQLSVGELLGLLPESLRYGFGFASKETPLEGARLDVDLVKLTLWCPNCERVVAPPHPTSFVCPQCEVASADITSGRELEIVSFTPREASAQLEGVTSNG